MTKECRNGLRFSAPQMRNVYRTRIRSNHQRCRGGMFVPISSKWAKAFGAVLSSAGMSGDELKARPSIDSFMRRVLNQSPTQIELIVSTDEARLRLDQFLARRLPEFSRSRLQQLIRDGFVRLNNSTSRPRQIVRGGDKIQLTEPPLEKIETLPEQIPLEILFEDNDLVVVNKPAGLVVHPGAGHREHTLVNALLNHCSMLSGIGGKERPGIVHRLDKETSGCLVVAKNDIAHRELSKQF